MKHHPSALGRAFICPASLFPEPDEAQANSDSEPIRTGVCVHSVLARILGGKDEPDLLDAAHQHRANVADVVAMVSRAERMWEEVGGAFPAAQVEVGCDDHEWLTGTIDVVSYVGGGAVPLRILDWKTGRIEDPESYQDQLMAYSILAARACGMKYCTTSLTVAFLRSNWTHTWTVTAADQEEWERRLKTHVLSKPNLYNPGPVCAHCPRRVTCQGRTIWTQNALSALSPTGIVNLLNPDVRNQQGAGILAVLENIRAIKAALDEAEGLLKTDLSLCGPIPLSDDRAIYMKAYRKAGIDAVAAYRVLAGSQVAWSNDEVLGCFSCSKTAVENAAGKKAPRGQKGLAKLGIINTLDEAGAITWGEFDRLTVGPAEDNEKDAE